MPKQIFVPLIEKYISEIKNSRKANGVDRIYLPGEIEAEKEKIAFLEGIDIDEDVVNKINSLLEVNKIDLQLSEKVRR